MVVPPLNLSEDCNVVFRIMCQVQADLINLKLGEEIFFNKTDFMEGPPKT